MHTSKIGGDAVNGLVLRLAIFDFPFFSMLNYVCEVTYGKVF